MFISACTLGKGSYWSPKVLRRPQLLMPVTSQSAQAISPPLSHLNMSRWPFPHPQRRAINVEMQDINSPFSTPLLSPWRRGPSFFDPLQLYPPSCHQGSPLPSRSTFSKNLPPLPSHPPAHQSQHPPQLLMILAANSLLACLVIW